MGSANLNDRSQRVRNTRICSIRLMFGSRTDNKGDGDSEIALVVEDEDHIPSMMNGRPYTAARFAASLRRKLFRRA
jgi:phospholipase D1/2